MASGLKIEFKQLYGGFTQILPPEGFLTLTTDPISSDFPTLQRVFSERIYCPRKMDSKHGLKNVKWSGDMLYFELPEKIELTKEEVSKFTGNMEAGDIAFYPEYNEILIGYGCIDLRGRPKGATAPEKISVYKFTRLHSDSIPIARKVAENVTEYGRHKVIVLPNKEDKS